MHGNLELVYGSWRCCHNPKDLRVCIQACMHGAGTMCGHEWAHFTAPGCHGSSTCEEPCPATHSRLDQLLAWRAPPHAPVPFGCSNTLRPPSPTPSVRYALCPFSPLGSRRACFAGQRHRGHRTTAEGSSYNVIPRAVSARQQRKTTFPDRGLKTKIQAAVLSMYCRGERNKTIGRRRLILTPLHLLSAMIWLYREVVPCLNCVC